MSALVPDHALQHADPSGPTRRRNGARGPRQRVSGRPIESLEARSLLSAVTTHLTINPTFDSTINNDPNAAAIKAAINTAIQNFASAFSDPITVAITFNKVSNGLASSSSSATSVTYSAYRAALASHATTASDSTALSGLPAVTNNPTNGNRFIQISTANARALGFSVSSPNDGTVNLNTSICNLDRANIDPNKFDLVSVAEHEIDEVLGIGSTLTGLSNGAAAPTGAVNPQDLFRYDASGARSFTTSSSAEAFFSLDGTTDIARFNQDATGDFNDWFSSGSHAPQVQDAFATAGSTPQPGTELTALDAIGYTPFPPHLPPVANDDGASTNANVPVTINVLANDSASGSASIDPAAVQLVTPPAHGVTSLDITTGTITYTPATGYSGPDSFTYTVNDTQQSVSNVATVSINVNPVASHRAPVAANDVITTSRNGSVLIDALSNDTAFDGAVLDPASLHFSNGPSHGSVARDAATGRITYKPANGYTGADSFNYSVTDSSGAVSNVSTVSINVARSTQNARRLVARAKSVRGVEGSSIDNAVVATFTDTDGDRTESFTASVDFGDGTIAQGAVQSINGHLSVIAPSHTYAARGRYGIRVSIADADGTSAAVSASASIAAARLRGAGADLGATPNVFASIVLGTIGSADPNGLLPLVDSPSAFTGLINWGDGFRSFATFSQDPLTHIVTVNGDHLYNQPGVFRIRTVVHKTGGGSLTILSNAQVS